MITLALRHVHARRIVHRDVKAANVFLTKKGVAKLGDFGVSRQLDVSGGGATQLASTRIGTPYYLAPEIFEGKPYGRSADVWSLGVLFYEILVLRMPFEANSLAALCVKITQSRAPNVIGYSADCAELVASLLHKDASQTTAHRRAWSRTIMCESTCPMPSRRRVRRVSMPTTRPKTTRRTKKMWWRP